jgi:hypothetical protein
MKCIATKVASSPQLRHYIEIRIIQTRGLRVQISHTRRVEVCAAEDADVGRQLVFFASRTSDFRLVASLVDGEQLDRRQRRRCRYNV